MVTKIKTAMLIPAAGKSSRMGEPKQLLHWEDTNLLGHTIKQGVAAGIKDIYVVLGAFHEKIKKTIDTTGVTILYNPEWEKGMGNTIARGTQEIINSPENYQRILIALCDQPLIEPTYYKKLLKTSQKDHIWAVATCYGKKYGVPAVFKSDIFGKLVKLNGKVGAKDLLNNLGKNAICVEPSTSTADIDKPEDYVSIYGNLKKR